MGVSLRLRSNPVLSFWKHVRSLPPDPMYRRERMAAWVKAQQNAGVRFPLHFQKSFAKLRVQWQPPSRLGVVGLVVPVDVERSDQISGLVVPLLAKRSASGWSTSRKLPFSTEDLQDILYDLLKHSGLSLRNAVPETVPFTFEEQLGEASAGSSMTIAGVLELIRAWNQDSAAAKKFFDCACSLVMRGENERLVDVSSIEDKLRGFNRECETGSLVVCTPAANREHGLFANFEHVWEVNSIEELAGRLAESGLLNELLKASKLTEHCLTEAEQRAKYLKVSRRLSEAVSFAERLNETVELAGAESKRLPQRAKRILENVHRDQGNFREAIRCSGKRREELLGLGELASYEELFDVEAGLASAHVDAHRFEAGLEVIRDSVELARRQPRVARLETRVALLNTQARLLAVCRKPGWQELFAESLRMQESLAPNNMARTNAYLVNGLLWNRQLEAAHRELEKFGLRSPCGARTLDPYTSEFLAAYRAELFRLKPAVGQDYQQEEEIERRLFSEGEGRRDERFNHPLGYYLIATARQPGRELDERRRRLERAAEVFDAYAAGYTEVNLLGLFAAVVRLGKEPESQSVREKLDRHLAQPGCEGQRAWFEEALSANPLDPDRLLERLLFI